MKNNFNDLYDEITALIEKNKNFISKGGHKSDIPDFSEGYDMGIASITDDLIEIVNKKRLTFE